MTYLRGYEATFFSPAYAKIQRPFDTLPRYDCSAITRDERKEKDGLRDALRASGRGSSQRQHDIAQSQLDAHLRTETMAWAERTLAARHNRG
jgi:hypothetical protein